MINDKEAEYARIYREAVKAHEDKFNYVLPDGEAHEEGLRAVWETALGIRKRNEQRVGRVEVSTRQKEWNEFHNRHWYPGKHHSWHQSFEAGADFVIAENAKIEALIAQGGEEGKKLAETGFRYSLALRWQARFDRYVLDKHKK